MGRNDCLFQYKFTWQIFTFCGAKSVNFQISMSQTADFGSKWKSQDIVHS